MAQRALFGSLLAMAVGFGVSSQAAMLTFDFPLSVSQAAAEPDADPDLAGAQFPGFQPVGIGTVTYDTVSDELTWNIQYIGLTSDLTAAHIHGLAAPGVIAGVLVNFDTGVQPQTGLLAGSKVVADFEDELLSGLTYVNLHTAQNPGGEIRGQVIPEPASLLLAAAGLGAMVWRRRTTA